MNTNDRGPGALPTSLPASLPSPAHSSVPLPAQLGAEQALALPPLRATALVAAATLLLSLFALAPSFANVAMPPWDKFAHAGYFGAVAALLLIAFGPRRWPLALIITSIAGIADEVHQIGVPGRHADPYDWLADTLAAASVVLLVRLLATRRH